MKKLLLLLFLSINLASCSKKDDDPAPVVTPSLLGTWSVTTIKQVSTSKQANGGAVTTTDTFTPNSLVYVFTADNKLNQTIDKSLSPTGVSVTSNTLYTYSNGVIVSTEINSTNKPMTYKVETLTDKLLVLSTTVDAITNIDDYTISLTRQ